VWQTAIITVGVVGAEMFHLVHDPHGFWLLYFLTVYSAVTQPALAHAGWQSSTRTDALLDRMSDVEAQNQRLLRHLEALISYHGLDPIPLEETSDNLS